MTPWSESLNLLARTVLVRSRVRECERYMIRIVRGIILKVIEV